jgi:hypothetical protein
MEVAAPELRILETVLEPSATVTRGGVELRDQLSVGEPLAIRVTPDFAGADAALAQFVAAEEATASYWLVHLACTFAPSNGRRIDEALLSVALERDDGAAAPPPIAWSMAPMVLERPTQQARTLKLGANLQAVQAGMDAGTTVTGAHVHLRAVGLHESRPAWEFRRTPADEVRGSYRLALVARVPRDAPASGIVAVEATIHEQSRMLRKMRARAVERSGMRFRLSGQP